MKNHGTHSCCVIPGAALEANVFVSRKLAVAGVYVYWREGVPLVLLAYGSWPNISWGSMQKPRLQITESESR
jgi:hypothetical protein